MSLTLVGPAEVVHTEEGTIETRVEELITYYASLDRGGVPFNKLIGNFIPIWNSDFHRIRDLQKVFQDVMTMPDMVFADFGSGLGMVPALASVVGYRAYGIEYDHVVFSRAKEILSNLRRMGIVQPTSVKLILGSYYTPNAVEKILADMLFDIDPYIFSIDSAISNALVLLGNLGIDVSNIDITDLEAMREHITRRMDEICFMSVTDNLPVSDSTWDIDVLYTFPSDPLLKYGLWRMISKGLRRGAKLVIPRMKCIDIVDIVNWGFTHSRMYKNINVFIRDGRTYEEARLSGGVPSLRHW